MELLQYTFFQHAQTYRQLAQMNYVHAKVSAQNYYSELLKALNKY